MSTAAEQAAQLRRQADALEETGRLGDELKQIKDAYHADQTPERKAAYRAAAQALSDARETYRADRPLTVEPGGVTITPGQVAAKGKAS
jgi:hypothetical protein